MRWIFFLLLLANAVFFGYMQFSGGRSEESLSAHAPLNAENVHLLGIAPLPSAKPKPAAPQVCLEWGSFANAELEQAKQALKRLNLGGKVAVRDMGEHVTYWVLIPPLKSKQDAEKKLAQVKALGVDDVALMPERDKWHNAVSLGLFSTLEAANKYLEEVRKKGVRSATVDTRGKDAKQSLFVKDASEAVSAELVKIKLDFPGSELKAVACEDVVKSPTGENK